MNLRQNAEDDYSTLLHLERVINMRDGGDFIPTLDTPIIQHAIKRKVYSRSLSDSTTVTESSGDYFYPPRGNFLKAGSQNANSRG